MNKNNNIGVGVVTSSNLVDRYTACKNTWINDFSKVYLFGGNGGDASLIPIKEAGENYNSHFLKQQLGLKYMFEDDDSLDWYCVTSCDAILFRNSTENELKNYDPNSDLVICQPCGYWTHIPFLHEVSEESESTFRAIAGGAGFFISNSLMRKCYKIIDEFNNHWSEISGGVYPFSDVAIAYMIKKYFNIELTSCPYILSQPPNHYEGAINGDENAKWYVDHPIPLSECLKRPLSFHYIKPEQMNEIYQKYK